MATRTDSINPFSCLHLLLHYSCKLTAEMNCAVIVAAALLTLVVSVNSCNSFGRRGLLGNVQPEVNIGVVFLSIKLVDFNVYK